MVEAMAGALAGGAALSVFAGGWHAAARAATPTPAQSLARNCLISIS
jgi:hypothetical protein